MGERIEFNRADGEKVPGYLAEPKDGKAGSPGLVVIQEWWGLNRQIQKVADRFATAGYRALVPDLYRGKVASTADEAQHLMSGLDWPSAEKDVQGALRHLKSAGGKAGVLGFCMGGAVTLLAAAHVPEVDAGVCFYGIPPTEAADPSRIRAPMLLHFATRDDWCTPASVAALESRLKLGNVRYQLYRYDAAHAFFNEARPEVYDAASATSAWDRTLAFLGAHLG